MPQHQSREKIEALVQFVDPHNKDLNPLQKIVLSKCNIATGEDGKQSLELDGHLTPDLISVILSKMSIEVLLDIRDVLYEISRSSGVSKWGPKIGGNTPSIPSEAPAKSDKDDILTPKIEDVCE